MDDNKNITFEDYIMFNSARFANSYGDLIEWVEKIQVAVQTELNISGEFDDRMELASYQSIADDFAQITYDLSYEFARFKSNITKKSISAIALEQAILFQSENDEEGVKEEFDSYKKAHVNAYDSFLDLIEVLGKLNERYPWVGYTNPEGIYKLDIMDVFLMIGQFYFMGMENYTEKDSEAYTDLLHIMFNQLELTNEINADLTNLEITYIKDAEDAIFEGIERLSADKAGVPYIQE